MTGIAQQLVAKIQAGLLGNKAASPPPSPAGRSSSSSSPGEILGIFNIDQNGDMLDSADPHSSYSLACTSRCGTCAVCLTVFEPCSSNNVSNPKDSQRTEEKEDSHEIHGD